MAVTGWNGAYIAALVGGNEFIYRFVPRDDVYIAKLISKEQSFWNMVKMKQEPPADGSKATENYLKNGYQIAKKDSSIVLDETHHKKPFGAWGPLYIMDEKPDVSNKNIKNPV